MELLTALLAAVQHLPNALYVTQKIMRKQTMSLCQKIIAALYQIANQERFGFYVAEEHALIGKIIEIAELPFEQESFVEVKSRLSGLTSALNKIGIEITQPCEGYLTVWGPGVKK